MKCIYRGSEVASEYAGGGCKEVGYVKNVGGKYIGGGTSGAYWNIWVLWNKVSRKMYMIQYHG